MDKKGKKVTCIDSSSEEEDECRDGSETDTDSNCIVSNNSNDCLENVESSDESVNSRNRGTKRKIDQTDNKESLEVLPKKKKSLTCPNDVITFKSVAGMDEILKIMINMITHLHQFDIYRKFGMSPPSRVLLFGPPGCGKTLLANAIAEETGRPLLKIVMSELLDETPSKAQQKIRTLFHMAMTSTPTVLLLDEIDAIEIKNQNGIEEQIVAKLICCLNKLSRIQKGGNALVIGTTRSPDSVDSSLRKHFTREIYIGVPNSDARAKILRIQTSNLPLSDDVDFENLGKKSHGFDGIQLKKIVSHAIITAVNRVLEIVKIKRKAKEKNSGQTVDKERRSKQMQDAVQSSASALKPTVEQTFNLEDSIWWLCNSNKPLSNDEIDLVCVTMKDFVEALESVQISELKGSDAIVPSITWEDIGGLSDVKKELQIAILAPVKYSDQAKKLGLTTPSWVLLCGPPGCGKTLLAKAIANEVEVNFVFVKGSELSQRYMNDGAEAVRDGFERARNSSPSAIFFDDLDLICPIAPYATKENIKKRAVTQMLIEMDSIRGRQDIFVLAASEKPDLISLEILKPGRLEKTIFVGMPTMEGRAEIIRAITKNGTNLPLEPDVDLTLIAQSEFCRNYTGADFLSLITEVKKIALREYALCEDKTKPAIITDKHFKKAVNTVKPSISKNELKYYERIRKFLENVSKGEERNFC